MWLVLATALGGLLIVARVARSPLDDVDPAVLPRNLTWCLVFLAALALYLGVLDRLRPSPP